MEDLLRWVALLLGSNNVGCSSVISTQPSVTAMSYFFDAFGNNRLLSDGGIGSTVYKRAGLGHERPQCQ